MFPQFTLIEASQSPFPYYIGSGGVSSHQQQTWLRWLENEASWELTVEDFYEQYEMPIVPGANDLVPEDLVHEDVLAALRCSMSEHFACRFVARVDVTAHMLMPGQTIRIHNDYLSGGETHRLLLQINRNWEPNQGGYLMFFRGSTPESVHQIVEPRSGSVQAFAISPRSYHAVSTVRSGKRFTLVYSFFQHEPP